jgi:hypothetical protein
MRKLARFERRPSPAMIVGIIALIAALGGGAYAATAKKKVTYKGLDKDARLKVLPFSKTASGTACNPTANDTFLDCATVNVDGSTGFPRKYYVSFTGTFDGVGGVARGDCRIEADNNPIAGTTRRFEVPTHTADHGEGFSISAITGPLGGKHAISVACDDAANDLRIHQFQLSAFQVR